MFSLSFIMKTRAIYMHALGKNQRETLEKNRQEMSYEDHVNERGKSTPTPRHLNKIKRKRTIGKYHECAKEKE
jgi:hypothetical protein